MSGRMQEIDILINAGKALLLDSSDTELDEAAIAVNDGLIIDIGPTGAIAPKYKAEKTINAADSLVMPGFVNSHTHAAMTCFRGMA
ncbi:MAG: amidohydrolase, partial [Smithellaceae bacterium]